MSAHGTCGSPGTAGLPCAPDAHSVPASPARRRALGAAAWPLLALPALSAQPSQAADALTSSSPLAFGLVGDTGYTDAETQAFDRVLDAMNADDLAFVVHVGDLKSGNSACTDRVLGDRVAQLGRSRHPLLFTPGDNDWTDCNRAARLRGAAATRLEQERLSHLRGLAFATPQSLGRRPIATQLLSASFPENRTWQAGSLLCATLHVVGSDDARADDAVAAASWRERLRANLACIDAMAQRARHSGAGSARPVRGLMLALHADMGADDPQRRDDPWAPVLDAIASLARGFGGPTLLVHGDSHFFKSDRPMQRSRGIDNLQRVICFGSPFSHYWVRIRWNPAGDPLSDDATRAAFFVATRSVSALGNGLLPSP